MRVVVDYKHQGTHDEGGGGVFNREGHVPTLLSPAVNHALGNHGLCGRNRCH